MQMRQEAYPKGDPRMVTLYHEFPDVGYKRQRVANRNEAECVPTKEYGKIDAETLINQAKSAILHFDYVTYDEASQIDGGLVAKHSGR